MQPDHHFFILVLNSGMGDFYPCLLYSGPKMCHSFFSSLKNRPNCVFLISQGRESKHWQCEDKSILSVMDATLMKTENL